MLPKFFRTYKNRQFTFIPRFYDEQKEELQERIRKAEREMKGSTGEGREYTKSIIRGSFRQTRQQRVTANRNSFLRLVLIIAILLLLVYFLFTV